MTSKRYGSDSDRFWSNVDANVKTGCWEWRAGTRSGYGYPRIKGKKISAHRYAYEVFYGQIPAGLIVRHKCDNRLCVNPKHLELGTAADNVADMDARGRRNIGEQRPGAKLTEIEVALIQADRRTHREIAKDHGVSHNLVGQIKRGTKWRHVESRL